MFKHWLSQFFTKQCRGLAVESWSYLKDMVLAGLDRMQAERTNRYSSRAKFKQSVTSN